MVSDKRAQGQYERASGVHHPTPSFLFREYQSALEALAKILALAASECEGIEAGESVGGVGIWFKKMQRFGCVQVKFRVIIRHRSGEVILSPGVFVLLTLAGERLQRCFIGNEEPAPLDDD